MARRQNLTGWLFASPVVIGLLVFTGYPFLASLYLSFCEYDIFNPPTWVGLNNYRILFTRDPLFWTSLKNVLYYTVFAVPMGITFGVALAMLLDAKIKGISVYRTIFFLPSIVPVVATSVLWLWLLNPRIGLVNTLLRLTGVAGPTWLGDPAWSKPSLIFMGVWGVGGSMIIYLAGLKDIPVTLYEAALVDGASTWQRIRHVTLPMITPVIFFNLVMGLIGSFQYFTQAFIMTGGGPLDSTLFYALHLFYQAFMYLKMGYASAMAWVLFVIVVAVTAVVFKTQGRWVHYGR
ncbi:MAG TPA: sugar ABC transporter permease [Candidatus Brocadiia bacterium]|nr:sugar ABC transporter permease [Candidatus Brocadiia bacterium]